MQPHAGTPRVPVSGEAPGSRMQVAASQRRGPPVGSSPARRRDPTGRVEVPTQRGQDRCQREKTPTGLKAERGLPSGCLRKGLGEHCNPSGCTSPPICSPCGVRGPKCAGKSCQPHVSPLAFCASLLVILQMSPNRPWEFQKFLMWFMYWTVILTFHLPCLPDQTLRT